jgi:PAS domain S-box-containing protein
MRVDFECAMAESGARAGESDGGAMLVVSADAEAVQVVSQAAQDLGLQVRQASRLEDWGDFELAVLDVDAPDLDVVAACRRLTESDGGVALPVLLWTRAALPLAAAAYLDAGAADVLRQPMPPEELAFRLEAHLRRARSAEDRHRTEERLTLVSQRAQDAIVMVDGEGRVTYWNEAAQRTFGYASSEIMGRNLQELLAPERFRELYQRVFQRFRASQESSLGSTRELWAVRRNGEEFLTELSLTAAVFEGKWCGLGIVRDITERRRMEESLRESEERFRKVFEEGSLGIAMIAPDTRIRRANEALCRMLGYSEDQLTGLSVLDITAAEDWEETHRRFEELVRAEVPHYQIKKRYQRKDGGSIWCNASVSLIRDSDGRASYCLAIIEDITERVRNENKMLSLVTAIDHTAEMVIITDQDGEILYTNPAYESFTGYSLEEARAMGLSLLARRYDGDQKRREAWSTIHAGSNWSGRFTNQKKNGEFYEEEATISPIRDEGGDISGFVTIKRDVTEKVRLEEESRRMQLRMQESESRLTKILECVPVGIALVSLDKQVRWANRMALDLVGAKTIEDILGQRCGAVLCESDARDCPFQQAGDVESSVETTICRRDGVHIPVLKRAQTLRFEHEMLRLESFIDLTQRRQLEAELGQARKLEAVGQLAAGVAHEVNTPIQYVGDSALFLKESFEAIQRLLPQYRKAAQKLEALNGKSALCGEIRRLEEESDLDWLLGELPASFERCLDGVDRVARIVRALKEFAHRGQRAQSPADLNHALETTLTVARNEYKYVADVETFYGNIPAVRCLVSELNQVFLNLVVNAAHAIGEVAGKSGARGRIRITTVREGDSVRIDVEDSGAGIPESIQDRIFEPFFTTKEVGKGTGQGLAIARSVVVDKHGGTLTFESRAGIGTRFTVMLPIDGIPQEKPEKRR